MLGIAALAGALGLFALVLRYPIPGVGFIVPGLLGWGMRLLLFRPPTDPDVLDTSERRAMLVAPVVALALFLTGGPILSIMGVSVPGAPDIARFAGLLGAGLYGLIALWFASGVGRFLGGASDEPVGGINVKRNAFAGTVACPRCGSMQTEALTWDDARDIVGSARCNVCERGLAS
ncbi:MAG: hypothetical protein KC933_06555 [Myxococcales bacterium]|nr:hypothetical protein [Myxococcales bacterium]MCB9649420.1 hypothetical protein [Deltaproteobacteria bacterium]